MKCISLWQPWSTLLVLGEKRFETRGWRLPENLIGQRVAIHAAKHFNREIRDLCTDDPFRGVLIRAGYWGAEDLPFGSIVGSVVFGGPWNTNHPKFPAMLADFSASERAFGDFSPGRWAWPASEPHKLAVPFPWKGAQGFFNVPVIAGMPAGCQL
jgi:hypothetical protein